MRWLSWRVCACISVLLAFSISLNVALFLRVQAGVPAPSKERVLVGDVPATPAPWTEGSVVDAPAVPVPHTGNAPESDLVASHANNLGDATAASAPRLAGDLGSSRALASGQANWTLGFEVEITRIEFVPTVETFAAWGGAHGSLLSKNAAGGSESLYSLLKVSVEGRGNHKGPWCTKPEIHTVPVALGDQPALEQLTRDFRRLAADLRRAQEGPTRRRKWGSGRWPDHAAEDLFVFPGTSFDAYMMPKEELKDKAINSEVYVQYSVGLPLRDVPSLLRPWLRLEANRDRITESHKLLLRLVPHARPAAFGVDPRALEGFLLLAGHAALGAIAPFTHGHKRQADCAKFYMMQLIVRTHFGDLFMGLTAGMDEARRRAFLDAHVLPTMNGLMDLDEVMFKVGVQEYAGLEGVARELRCVGGGDATGQQLAGLVLQRALQLGREEAEDLLASQKSPTLHIEQGQRSLTVRIWLQGLLQGKDLMSDHDSWLQGLVIFKNMGKVRSQSGDALMEFRTGFLERNSRVHSHLANLEDVPNALVQLAARLQKQRALGDTFQLAAKLRKQRAPDDA